MYIHAGLRKGNWGNQHGSLGNWDENCFPNHFYHPSFSGAPMAGGWWVPLPEGQRRRREKKGRRRGSAAANLEEKKYQSLISEAHDQQAPWEFVVVVENRLLLWSLPVVVFFLGTLVVDREYICSVVLQSCSVFFFSFLVSKTFCWWQSIRPLVVLLLLLIQCSKTEGRSYMSVCWM